MKMGRRNRPLRQSVMTQTEFFLIGVKFWLRWNCGLSKLLGSAKEFALSRKMGINRTDRFGANNS
jgi:hypothetical protein